MKTRKICLESEDQFLLLTSNSSGKDGLVNIVLKRCVTSNILGIGIVFISNKIIDIGEKASLLVKMQ